MNSPPSRTADQFVVRMPDGLRDRLAAAAKTNGRSMNAEVVALLTAGLGSTAPSLAGVSTGDLLDAVAGRLGVKVQILVAPEVDAVAGIKKKRTKVK